MRLDDDLPACSMESADFCCAMVLLCNFFILERRFLVGSFSFMHWVIFGLIGFFLYKIFKKDGGDNKYCKTCGYSGSVKSKTKGSLIIEIILWICFIIPGLIYSVWRMTTKGLVCPSCGGTELIPVNSPIAQQLLGSGVGKRSAVRTSKDFDTDIVGESNYQGNLAKICGNKKPEGEDKVVSAKVILDNNNKHDRNAVAVQINGLLVGYLSRDAARCWRAANPPAQFDCQALINGGWKNEDDEGLYGVRLNVVLPD